MESAEVCDLLTLSRIVQHFLAWSTFSARDRATESVSVNDTFPDIPVRFFPTVFLPQTAQPDIQVLANWTNENGNIVVSG